MREFIIYFSDGTNEIFPGADIMSALGNIEFVRISSIIKVEEK